MDVEMNKTIWNSERGLWEYPLPLFGIEKKGPAGLISVFGNYLAPSPGLTCATIYCL